MFPKDGRGAKVAFLEKEIEGSHKKVEAVGKGDEKPQKVVVTSPLVTDVVVTQHYSGLIRARRHIELRAFTAGYLEAVPVKEGQAVKKGDVLFKVAPALYKAKLDAELAEVKLAEIELANAKTLLDKKAATRQEVNLYEAKLAKAQAKAKLAEVELDFTSVKAPYDGFLGRLGQQEGSLVKEGDVLTSLSDNSVMWVYFHVPEARYLEHKARQGDSKDHSRLELADSRIDLVLADDSTFKQNAGNVVTIEGIFNQETGTIACRADFPNPDRLLRHGQTGTVLIRRTLKNVTAIPQRATFEILDRRYVSVVGKDDVVQLREIVVQNETEDLCVVKKGLDVTDKIVLEGGRQLRDGDTVESVFRKPEGATGRPKTTGEK
ncbi:efflux RND transporter periplasmic adaptor subunit [Limnoglobus roseus]|uniref:efflux RND transporter periplasmic adaptor subunit n=1 Tax=Limnoglobus roseus TaxID=2598579 RepID=UPI001FECC981|nr:efflux RND transporter periplasmic adaptor subunit [Limnoglobus roseus]